MNECKPHILLVIEDDILADVTSFRLELLGYRISIATSGRDALAMIRKTPADAVIVDMALTQMKGLELIETLGRDQATTKVPVMALAYDAELDSVQQAFRAGAMDYLVVPYNPHVLESKIEQLLSAPSTKSS